MNRTVRVTGTIVGVVIVLLIAALLVRSRPSPESGIGAVGPTPSAFVSSSLLPAVPVLPSQSSFPSPSDGESTQGTPGPNEHGLSCGVHTTDAAWDSRFFDVEFLTDYSTAVVIGDVIEIGDGRWATESGEPPAEEEVVRPNALYVYRVITVEVSDVVKQREGEEAWEPGSSIEVRALGGTIGCLTFLLSGDFQFEHGDEVALFLGGAARACPSTARGS